MALLFDFAMQRHLVELRAEFHELKSFRIISSILGGGVSRHAGCSLSEADAVLHSVHSRVTIIRTPLLLAITI